MSRFSFLRLGFGARLTLLISAAGLSLALIIGLWHSGFLQRQLVSLRDSGLILSQKAGFSVRDVVVEGRHYTDRNDLFTALGTTIGAPMMAFDPAPALERIRGLPWIASAVVERQGPDVIALYLTERQPMARWQHDGKVVVIDDAGKELSHAKPEAFATLPLVVGSDAPEHARALLNALKDFPFLASIVKAATRVGNRRWDLYLQPNLVVRLPEKNNDVALTRLASLIRDEKLLERHLVAVDLRLPDRMILEPPAEVTNPTEGSRP